MMTSESVWKPSRRFPFRGLYGLGVLLVLLGLAVLSLGIALLIYTEYYYGFQKLDDCRKPDYAWVQDPCFFESIVYFRVVPGIWSGFFIIFAAAIGTSIARDKPYLRQKRDALGVLAFLVVFPVAPAGLAISVIQLVFTEDVFFYVDKGETVVLDVVMFILPLVISALIFVCWCGCIAYMAMVCACGDLYEDDATIIKKYRRPNLPPPTLVNRFRPQFVGYRDPCPEPEYGMYGPFPPPSTVYAVPPPPPQPFLMAPQPTYYALPPPPPPQNTWLQSPYKWMTSRNYIRW